MRQYGHGLAACVCAGCFFLLALGVTRSTSLTWDEPSFISAGYAYVLTGQFDFNASHPPLMQDLEGLSLVAHRDEITVDPRYAGWSHRVNPVAVFARAVLSTPGLNVPRIAFWARLPVVILGTLLVLGVYLWGRQLFGPGPALLGTALVAFSPVLIGHASVATEDMGCAFFSFMSIWALTVAQRRSGRWRWILFGAVTGLALVAKYTSLVLLPVIAILVLVHWRRTKESWKATLLDVSCAAVPALVIIALFYRSPLGIVTWLGGVTKIYSDMHPASFNYMLGMASGDPFWSYTLVAWVLKEPMSYVAASIAGSLVMFRFLKNRPELLAVALPPVAFIGVSLFDRHDLGLRRILPALPFLYLGTGEVARRLTRKRALAFGVVTVALGIIAVARVYPDELGAFNGLVGSSRRGAELLNDSNIDWGQDLPALARWQAAHPEDAPLRLAYYGRAEPSWYGVHAKRIPRSALVKPLHGYVAVSVQYLTWLSARHLALGAGPDGLRDWKPIAWLGTSIAVYRFP